LTVAAVLLSRPTFFDDAGTPASSSEALLRRSKGSTEPKEGLTMKDAHAEKGAHNQALIREVNERIEQVAEDAAHPEFLCECADTNCVEMIELSISEYESIRSSPVRFPVKLGHDYPEFERVVEECENYAIVEKFGEAARIVKKRDPRSRTT
jgi:hypothetical protein